LSWNDLAKTVDGSSLFRSLLFKRSDAFISGYLVIRDKYIDETCVVDCKLHIVSILDIVGDILFSLRVY
jgi:hypothetical protein